MRYGVLFTEDESDKLFDIFVYYEQEKDIKTILADAINVMHNTIAGNNNG